MKNKLLALAVLLAILISACEESGKETMTKTEAQTLLTEAATAYGIFATTQEEATRAGLETETLLKSAQTPRLGEYPQITIDPPDLTTWPKTITVDYGPENVMGADFNNRRGKLIITASNFPTVENATWEIAFSDFYHNDHKVEGLQTITYMGRNAKNHPFYQCTVTNGLVTAPGGKVFQFEQQTQREWVSGYDTHAVLTGNNADFCDDEYKIMGTHNGVSSDGYAYTMTTPAPLLVGVCCKWVKEGILSVNLQDHDLSCEINYRPADDTGDNCNNQATFTIFGTTIPITLP